ncbi:MAG: hypothetical protein WC997_18170, partial [Porticoccaceae bacterium]
FLCRECDEEGWSTYAVMPHEVPSTGEFLHVEPLYASPVAAQAQPVVNQQMTTDLLERVSDALGRFVSDEGWGHADMDLCDEFSAALAALSSVQDREDAQRLNWLDAQNARFRMGWRVGQAPAGNVRIDSVIVTGRSKPASIREAIDAARAAKEQS